MKGCFFVFFLCAASAASYAGAWTLKEDESQIISECSYSWANREFGEHKYLEFKKYYIKDTYEYGWKNTISIISSAQYVSAKVNTLNSLEDAKNFSFSGGIRTRIMANSGGVVSAQFAFTSSQPYTITASQNEASGNEVELRLLYGNSFKLFDKDSFAEVETGWRLTSRPRPNEAVWDATVGVWFFPDTMAMLQTFNTYSAGYGRHPYVPYRLNKLELSLVERWWDGLSVQVGWVAAVSGNHIVAERGMSLSLWLNF